METTQYHNRRISRDMQFFQDCHRTGTLVEARENDTRAVMVYDCDDRGMFEIKQFFQSGNLFIKTLRAPRY
jgi:hypothetical protein